jgi:hypothetical protein
VAIHKLFVVGYFPNYSYSEVVNDPDFKGVAIHKLFVAGYCPNFSCSDVVNDHYFDG